MKLRLFFIFFFLQNFPKMNKLPYVYSGLQSNSVCPDLKLHNRNCHKPNQTELHSMQTWLLSCNNWPILCLQSFANSFCTNSFLVSSKTFINYQLSLDQFGSQAEYIFAKQFGIPHSSDSYQIPCLLNYHAYFRKLINLHIYLCQSNC